MRAGLAAWVRDMSFLFKSAIGLGCVYFAMFAPAMQSTDIAPAKLCQSAAKASLNADAPVRAQWVAAGCAAALGAVAQNLTPAAPAPRSQAKRGAGTLSDDDLRAPWFGPERILRKSERRG